MGLGWDEVKLPFPVGPGDELDLEMTVLEMRESKSRSDSGIRSKPKGRRYFTRRTKMTGIDGKVVAITGASSGIGRAAALLLAGRGAKVVLGARRTDELEALVREIEGAGGDAIFNGTNVAKREDVAALTALACDRYGKLDVFISNAGIGPISKLEDLRVEDWEAMVDINIKGLLYGIAAALPIFRRQGFGHFVNTISTAGIQMSPTMAVYAATKNAVRTLSEGLRIESNGNYRVTGISPGFVGTNFAQSMTNPETKAAIQSAWTRSRWSRTRSPAQWRSRSSSRTMLTSATSSSGPPSRTEHSFRLQARCSLGARMCELDGEWRL